MQYISLLSIQYYKNRIIMHTIVNINISTYNNYTQVKFLLRIYLHLSFIFLSMNEYNLLFIY